MMIMTAKVDLKKVLVILGTAAALILGLILLLGKSPDAQTTSAPVSGNDARVKFLSDFGWDVTNSPTESGQVRIPGTSTEVFERYNRLQQAQGYDLSPFAGKNVMRYVYQINNYPGATDPVYATVLVYKNKVIGGDVTDTSPGGRLQGFKMPSETAKAPEPTAGG